MGIKALAHVLHHSKQKGTRLLCLIGIANYADDNGFAYPGMDTIAEIGRTDRRTAIRYIQDAETDGEVAVYERLSEVEGDNLSNLYKLALPGTEQAAIPQDLRGKVSPKPRTPKAKKAKRGKVVEGVGNNPPPSGQVPTPPSGQVPTPPSGQVPTPVVGNNPPDPLFDPSSPTEIEPKDSAPSAGAGRKPKKERERDPIFDAVALHIFEQEAAEAEGGRIAKIANWLKGKYDGRGKERMGKISKPAEVKHIELFAKYCKAEGFTPPMDFVKFVEQWRKWASKARSAADHSPQVMTLEEYDQLLEEQNG